MVFPRSPYSHRISSGAGKLRKKQVGFIDVNVVYVKLGYMSGRRLGNAVDFQPVTVQSKTTRLDLPAGAIQIRKNGIEFRSASPFPIWSEMTVALQTPQQPREFNCTGVVVACTGSQHTGFLVSMVFTDLSRQAQTHLTSLVCPQQN